MNVDLKMPARVAALTRDKHGRPVPWFVAWIDGTPDFRIIVPGRIVTAVREKRCWMCGGPMGRYMAFVIGPMCAVNRNTAEPPCHTDCALYAVQACPFLATPNMVRRENGKPEGASNPAGHMLTRNPGVALVWVTRGYHLIADGPGVLFRLGEPTETHWYVRGRKATRAEVMHSIDTGLPVLRGMADEEGGDAPRALDAMVASALRYVPAAST